MNKISKLLCLTVATLSVLSFAACGELNFDEVTLDSDGTLNLGGGGGNFTASEEDPRDSWKEQDSTVELPPIEEPNPLKKVVREEVDGIGHKVVYYLDGTHEDLGRVEPLDFSSPAPRYQYGYQAFAEDRDGDGLCAFYEDLYDLAAQFHDSTVNLSRDSQGEYSLPALDFSEYDLSAEQAAAVWRVFTYENPAFFWLDNGILTTDSELLCLVHEDYARYKNRVGTREKIEEFVFNCDATLSGSMTEKELALAIYEYIANELAYAYETDGVTPSNEFWAHNITGAALYNAGVCETYAMLYDYICTMLDIECMTVTGMAGQRGAKGPHAWNYVYIDKTWYAVDVTWGDQEKLDTAYFGMNVDDYYDTHTPTAPTRSWGINYQCEMPMITKGISLVVIGEM